MRRPKGIKTNKAAAKRFKVTASGKIKRARAGRRHLLTGKNAKRRRSLGKGVMVDSTDVYRILGSMPFTR